MGRSVTCNYQVQVNLSDGSQAVYGAMNLRQCKNVMDSDIAWRKEKNKPEIVTGAYIWPQTAVGQRVMKLDFIEMDLNGNITHKEIS